MINLPQFLATEGPGIGWIKRVDSLPVSGCHSAILCFKYRGFRELRG
jgi:hypothetical protein